MAKILGRVASTNGLNSGLSCLNGWL